MSKHLWVFLGGLAILAAVNMIVGCDTGTTPDLGGGDDTGTEGFNGPIVGRVKGVVSLPDGSPIEGVTVTQVGTENMAQTASNGYYELLDVTPGDVMVRFTKRGYTGNTRDVEVSGWETRTLNARLLEVDAYQTLATSAGGRVETSEFKIDFPANGYVSKADGTPLNGAVEVAVTHIDPTTDEIWAAPNDFTALAGPEETLVGLMSYAMVDVQMTVDGEEAELASNVVAAVEMVIPDNLPEMQQIQMGDVIPTWHFDEAQGIWVHEGETTVIPSTTDPGRMAGTIQAPYFSAWNLDDCWMAADQNGNQVQVCANQPITCVTGIIDDVGENDVIGADVYSGAQNFQGAVSGTTDEDGRYILWPIMEGAVIDVRAEVVIGNTTYSTTDGSYAVAAPGGVSLTSFPTDWTQCMEVPDIEIPACVVGAVVEVDNRRLWDGNGAVIEDATTGKAYFFEPDGAPETCSNIDPVDLPEDTCDIVPVEDDMMDFFWGQEPLDAGQDVEVIAGNDTVTLEQIERVPDDHYYEVSTVETPLPFDTWMDIRATGQQGNVNGGIPALDIQQGLPMGREVITTDPPVEDFFAIERNRPMPIRTQTYDDEAWGNIAMIVPEDTSQGICLCRFKDDGAFDVPADVTARLPEGPAAMIISRIKADLQQMPNGYWARTLGRASTTTIGDIQN